MAAGGIFRRVREKAALSGDESRHEQTDAWSNRDLIPLPPARRTWGIFNFFAFHTGSSLNISAWQTPNTYLTLGLSIKQSMGVIIVARFIVALFTILISWCGLKWHVGFTVQSRHTWGLRGSYIPLLQRILLNFMWTSIQCWNGGRSLCVCLVAIWPSFANIKNTFGENNPTTTYQFVGFVVFWFISTPFLFIRPENYKLPYQIITIYTALAMLSMCTSSSQPASSASQANDAPSYLVSGRGKGSRSKSRAGVFFISFAFALNLVFENIFQNAVAGGIDLAGLFPRYINIRRGAFLTFIAVWICQPWQLVNRAATFVTVLNSFAVFFAPIMGVMFTDYYLVQKGKIKLTSLYHPVGSIYWFYHGFNLRVIPAWIAGWAPTIGGLIATIGGYTNAPRGFFELYRIAFFLGFSISALFFYVFNLIWPETSLSQIDEVDVYGTFTEKEAARAGVVPLDAVDLDDQKPSTLPADANPAEERPPAWKRFLKFRN